MEHLKKLEISHDKLISCKPIFVACTNLDKLVLHFPMFNYDIVCKLISNWASEGFQPSTLDYTLEQDYTLDDYRWVEKVNGSRTGIY